MKLSLIFVALTFFGAARAQQASPDYCQAISCQDLYNICTQACVKQAGKDLLKECKAACGGHSDWCKQLCPDDDQDERHRALSLFGKKTTHNETIISKDEDEHGCKTMTGYKWCPTLKECVNELERPCPSEAPLAVPVEKDRSAKRLRV